MQKKIYIFAFLFCVFLQSLTADSFIDTKRAIVTGGAGFLGSHLCDRLIEEGFVVICVDNLQTGSLKNISHHESNPNFRFVDADVCSFDYSGEKIDVICHLACPASPPMYQKDPIHTLKTNFLGTLNMLEIAKKHQAQFFFSSTSEVYGNPYSHPQTESYWGNVNPIGIRACYDEGKRIAETLCFEYHRNHDVAIKVVRIFNTYGPRMDLNDGRVVTNFISQALSGEDITVFGDGTQTRSFCYVDDLINGFRKFMESDNIFTGPVNLGNPDEMNMMELAQKVLALTQSQSGIILKALPQDDPVRRKPDITLARQKLNWDPQTSLEEGLLKTINYFRGLQENLLR